MRQDDQQRRAEQIYRIDRTKFEAAMIDGGWLNWINAPPVDRFSRVEMIRYEWDGPIIARPIDMGAQFNICDTYWRRLHAPSEEQ